MSDGNLSILKWNNEGDKLSLVQVDTTSNRILTELSYF